MFGDVPDTMIVVIASIIVRTTASASATATWRPAHQISFARGLLGMLLRSLEEMLVGVRKNANSDRTIS